MSGTGGSRPAPLGVTQQMLPPGQAWFDPNTGAPTNAAWQFFFSIFVRTGGVIAPVGTVGGQIGLSAVQAQAAQAAAVAANAQMLGMLDLMKIPDPVKASTSHVGDDALAVALIPPDVKKSVESFSAVPLMLGLMEQQQWRAGNVRALGSGLTLVGGTLSAAGGGGGGIYAPLVNGDLPGPTLISDPSGQCIMVPIT